MLPDIPTLKQEISKNIQLAVKQRVNMYLGAINEVPRYYIQEGDHVVTIRRDGRTDETQLTEASAETFIKLDEVPHLTPQKRLEKLDEMAREIARQISESAFNEINKAVEGTGNIVDGGGQPLSPEIYLEVIEKIQMDFDTDGNPSQLTIAVPPNVQDKAVEVLKQLQTDPEYANRYKEIIDKKRRQWRVREAARKLVG